MITGFIADGRALLDGITASKNVKVRAGQVVEFEPPTADAEGLIAGEAMPLDVLYEDDHIAVLNKPAGLCVHPSPGHWSGTLVNGVIHRWPRAAFIGSVKRPAVVHRLDQDTSGAIVFALSPQGYAGMVGILKSRRAVKEYTAVVFGTPQLRSATINMPIGRDPEHRRKFAVIADPGRLTAKPAVTHYDVERSVGEYSILKVRIETGRTHQIRVHLKKIGHPVVGDRFYAPERNHPIDRQALHAHRIAFPHPVTAQPVDITAPLPADMNRLMV